MNKRQQENICAFVVVVLSFLTSLFMFSPNLKTKLGAIDDHEIVRFLGSDRALYIWQIPDVLLNKTEVGQYGETPRFRPVYYLFRLLETSAFGVNSQSWYFARIIMVTAVCSFLALGLIKLINLRRLVVLAPLTLIFIIQIVELTAWRDIVSRLGPAEIYLCLGFSIFFYLASAILVDGPTLTRWAALSAIFVLTVGVKENAIVLSVFYILLFIITFKSNNRKFFVSSAFVLSITCVTIFFVSWFLGLRNVGADLYGNTRSFSSAFMLIFEHFAHLVKSPFTLVISAALIYFLRVILKDDESSPRSFIVPLTLVMSMQFIVLSEFVFYNGNFTDARYLAISEISNLITVAICLVLFINKFANIGLEKLLARPRFVFFIALAISALIVPSAMNARTSFETEANYWKSKNETFQENLSIIRSELSTNMYSAVVIQIDGVWDYEPAYAMSQYLEFYEAYLPRFLNVMPINAGPGIETQLVKQLNEYAVNGDGTWLIDPISTLNLKSKVYCVAFNEAAKDRAICHNRDSK